MVEKHVTPKVNVMSSLILDYYTYSKEVTVVNNSKIKRDKPKLLLLVLMMMIPNEYEY
jgi:hypothetical protein